MPDEQGKLADDDRERIVKWLKEHTAQHPLVCSVCGNNNWVIGEHLVAPTIFSTGYIIGGGPAYPQIMIICKICGHTVFFNSVLIGLSKSSSKEEKPEEEEKDQKKEGVNG